MLMILTGLAILFFVLSLVGNLTYGGGVSRGSLASNAPSLIKALSDHIAFRFERLSYDEPALACGIAWYDL